MMFILSQQARDILLARVDDLITRHVEVKASELAELAALRLQIEGMAQRLRDQPLRLTDFRNALGILRSIDLHDLQAVGLLPYARQCDARLGQDNATSQAQWLRWVAFRDSPIEWLLHSNDETQRKIWEIVALRLQPTITVSEAHRTDLQAAP